METDVAIEESNKLIAIFIGKTIQGDWVCLNDMYNGQYSTCLLDYHKNWNSLMPVVEKIEDLRKFDDFGFNVCIDNWQVVIKSCLSGEIIVSILSGDSKIEAVWKAVIQFIQWYNQQSKTT